MKRKYKLLSIVLSICLFLGMLPLTALATGAAEYNLWIGGVQVTDDNKNDITSAITGAGGTASGSATFDPATNTLILDNFNCAGKGYTFNIPVLNTPSYAVVHSRLDTLNITLKNNSSLIHSATQEYASYGIYTEGSLVITEDSTGTLTAQSDTTNLNSCGIFIYDGNLSVNGGTLVGKAGNTSAVSTGIWCFSGDITVNANAKLTGNGGNGVTGYGICASGKLTVNGGSAEGTTGTGGNIARGINVGTIESSSENSKIIGTADNANASAGIYIWNPAVFSNGSMKGVSIAGSANESYGIFMDNESNDILTIDGGTVIGQGLTGAFNKAPVIDSAFIDAGIWYGDNETEANDLGVRLRSNLASNHGKKYVRIDSAPLFDVSVSSANLFLTEGTIHKAPVAKVTASYVSTNNPNNPSTSYTYQWYSCDESGDNRTAAEDGDNIDNEYRISEDLTPGTYYYICEVSGYDYHGNFVASVSTDVVKVEVSTGTSVVIFDPDFGSFAEIGSVTIEVPIKDGKLTGDVPRPAAEGYAFKGWYTKDGEWISDPANYTFNHTTRLYARYSKIYTATFDANGGMFSDGTSLYSVKFIDDALYNDKVPADPTREGYIFQGWYYKDKEGNECKLELSPGQDYYELVGDFRFYAKWLKAEAMPPNNTPPESMSEPETMPQPESALQPESTPQPDDVHDTGDRSHIGLWLMLTMLSFMGITTCVIAWRRKAIK